eukprot:Awhi_evm2s10857
MFIHLTSYHTSALSINFGISQEDEVLRSLESNVMDRQVLKLYKSNISFASTLMNFNTKNSKEEEQANTPSHQHSIDHIEHDNAHALEVCSEIQMDNDDNNWSSTQSTVGQIMSDKALGSSDTKTALALSNSLKHRQNLFGHETKKIALRIYNLFIKDDCHYLINISSQAREDIEHVIANPHLITATSFDPAAREIEFMLNNDSVRRFQDLCFK